MSTHRFSASLILVFLGATTLAPSQTVQLEAGTRQVQINGAGPDEWLGRPMVCAYLDNDGFDDLVVGCDRTTIPSGEQSRVLVFRGSATFLNQGLIDLSQPGNEADLTILGETGSEELATAMATGDFNDDGIADLALADSTLTAASRAVAGAVYILYGSPTFFSSSTRNLAASQWDVKFLGATAGDDTGGSSIFTGQLSSGLAMGDLNNDGIDDIAMGAHLADPGGRNSAGAIRVVYGEASLPSGTTFDLATQADSNILGGQSENELGTALAIGDVNGDSIDDLVAGQEFYSQTTFASEGAVLVFFGGSSFPASLNLASQAPSVRILGAIGYDTLGSEVVLGDINGDTILDIIALAPGWDKTNSTSIDEGAVYAFHGRATWPAQIALASTAASLRVTGNSSTASLSNALVAGNFTADAYADILVTARDSSRGTYATEGRSFVVTGGAALPATLSLSSDGASHAINGGVAVTQLGDRATTGDLNGDGLDEIILSVPFVNDYTGSVFIFGTPLPALSAGGRGWWFLQE